MKKLSVVISLLFVLSALSVIVVSAGNSGSVWHKFVGNGECHEQRFQHYPPQGQGWTEGPCPTQPPTEETEEPTQEATTPAPTDEPTEVVTDEPTQVVTDEPTDVATEIVTDEPTDEATRPVRIVQTKSKPGAQFGVMQCMWPVPDQTGVVKFVDQQGGWQYGSNGSVDNYKVTLVLGERSSKYLYRIIVVTVNDSFRLSFMFTIESIDGENHIVCKRVS